MRFKLHFSAAIVAFTFTAAEGVYAADQKTAAKREKPEDIVLKLRQVEVLQGQSKPVQEAVRQISVTAQTYYRWLIDYGGMNRDQLKH